MPLHLHQDAPPPKKTACAPSLQSPMFEKPHDSTKAASLLEKPHKPINKTPLFEKPHKPIKNIPLLEKPHKIIDDATSLKKFHKLIKNKISLLLSQSSLASVLNAEKCTNTSSGKLAPKDTNLAPVHVSSGDHNPTPANGPNANLSLVKPHYNKSPNPAPLSMKPDDQPKSTTIQQSFASLNVSKISGIAKNALLVLTLHSASSKSLPECRDPESPNTLFTMEKPLPDPQPTAPFPHF
ncbi:hypothetical protein PCANC_16177 [Puccinia coronata f. sp. avenae]|uniref:Uncharacterized protein n=1 Tax=Puccinia coronata f. sp. avenae TaxID=200324 RepID=A0A2N5SZ68_9BASI|nr:hypothetical protein PCANC_16177 [Puccinia coronata f. sp. avenae]